MTEYDYGNARLRAMKSRLLSSERLLILAEVRSIDLLITQLSKTPYQRAAEIAIIRSVGLERINMLLRYHLVETVAKLRHFYSGVAQELISILLMRYDIHNLKTILRGLSQHVPPAQMTSAFLPIGELTHNILTQLTSAEKAATAVDMLASMQFIIAQPLIELRSQYSNATVAQMELRLEQWYFQHADETVIRLRQQDNPLMAALKMEADVINLLTTLRFVHTAVEQQQLLEQLQASSMSELYVWAGHLSHQILEQVAQENTMQEAVELLHSTQYGDVLSEGLNQYRKRKLLSEFGKVLRQYRTGLLSRNIARDSLGIGVPLGYLALKENEIRNIRAIAWGIQLGHDSDTIKQDLEFLA